MNTEQDFLVTYGLHNFVSYSRNGERGIFTICNDQEGQKMTRHASNLIMGRYGENIDIVVA